MPVILREDVFELATRREGFPSLSYDNYACVSAVHFESTLFAWAHFTAPLLEKGDNQMISPVSQNYVK